MTTKIEMFWTKINCNSRYTENITPIIESSRGLEDIKFDGVSVNCHRPTSLQPK